MKKRRSPAKSREKVLVFWVLGLFLGSVLLVGSVNTIRSEMKENTTFGPYLGSYQFESVSGKMKQQVGDYLTVDMVQEKLTLKVVKDFHRYRLISTGKDDFEIEPGKIGVTFTRGPDGKVEKLVSRPNHQGFIFVLKKM